MKDFKQKWWCATYIMANLHLREEYSVQRSFPIVELVGFFKHSQFYLQNNDFILPNGLYQDCLPKHFLHWPFLTTSLPSLFLTLIPVSSAIAFRFVSYHLNTLNPKSPNGDQQLFLCQGKYH